MSPCLSFLILVLQGIYQIDREASEPDPHIVDLNAELAKCDDFAATTLPVKERRYVCHIHDEAR